MAEEQRYIATVDIDTDREDLGVRKIAFTKNPAIMIKGVAFSAETSKVNINSDSKKMRICAPVLVPTEIYRKSEGGHTLVFTKEEIELMNSDFMKRLNNTNPLFKKEHTDKSNSPAYILESWIVQDEKTDKANTIYNLNVPVGSWVVIIQVTDEKYFDQLANEGVTGLSIEGFLGHKLELSELFNYSDSLVIKDGKVLLLKRTEEEEFEPNKWGFPGGKIEENESAQEAAGRELFEETGLTCQSIEPLEVLDNEDGTTTSYFIANCTDYDGELVLSDEHTEGKYFSIEELKDLPVIKDQNERVINLINKAMDKGEAVKVSLPDGEYKDKDGKVFVVKNGEVVTDQNLESEKEKEGEEIEMSEEELEDGGKLSFEGELKEGSKTTAENGDYKTKSGKTVSVKDGIVSSVKDSEKSELEGEGEPTEPAAASYSKEEVDKMLMDLKDEVSKMIAEFELKMEEKKATEKGASVEMSEEEKAVSRIVTLREAYANQ